MSSSNHDVNLILKARDEASAKLNRLSGTIRGLALGIAGYFSAAAITGFLKSSVSAFAESEQAARGLSDALQSMGQSGDISGLESFSKQMQELTTYEHDAVLASMKLGVTIGGLSGRDLTAATTAAIGLSKAFNIDLDSAMRLISKGATGNFNAFSRMGITFREGETDAQKYAEVLARGAAGFSIARGETDTFDGTLKQLSNSWRVAKENLGQYIAGNEGLRTFIQALQVGIEHFGTVMDLVVTNAFLNMVTFAENVKFVFTDTIPTAVNWFADHWKEIFEDIFNGTKSIFENLGKNIYDFFAAVVSWCKGDGFNFEWTGLTEGFKTSISQLPEFAQRQQTELEKVLDEEAVGYAGILQQAMEDKKNQSFDAGAAVAGAGMGNVAGGKGTPFAEKHGWSLFESRTAGGSSARESPESRKLDRMIDLLARIAAVNTRDEHQQNYIRGGGPALQLTHFR
jgi:hypothetical protein